MKRSLKSKRPVGVKHLQTFTEKQKAGKQVFKFDAQSGEVEETAKDTIHSQDGKMNFCLGK